MLQGEGYRERSQGEVREGSVQGTEEPRDSRGV